jgi:hypothetical protein
MKALTVDGVDVGRLVPLTEGSWRIDGRYRTFYYLLEAARAGEGEGEAEPTDEGEAEPTDEGEAEPTDEGEADQNDEGEADQNDEGEADQTDEGGSEGVADVDERREPPPDVRDLATRDDAGCGCGVTQGRAPWFGARR